MALVITLLAFTLPSARSFSMMPVSTLSSTTSPEALPSLRLLPGVDNSIVDSVGGWVCIEVTTGGGSSQLLASADELINLVPICFQASLLPYLFTLYYLFNTRSRPIWEALIRTFLYLVIPRTILPHGPTSTIYGYSYSDWLDTDGATALPLIILISLSWIRYDIGKYGVAGLVAFVGTELAFWMVALLAALVLYHPNNGGHWPNIESGDDPDAVVAFIFAAMTVVQVLLPVRFSLGLAKS